MIGSMARPPITVTRGEIAAARMEARTGSVVPVMVLGGVGTAPVAVQMTRSCAASWDALGLPPGHVTEAFLNSLACEIAERGPLRSALWGTHLIPGADGCWVATVHTHELTWTDTTKDPVLLTVRRVTA